MSNEHVYMQVACQAPNIKFARKKDHSRNIVTMCEA